MSPLFFAIKCIFWNIDYLHKRKQAPEKKTKYIETNNNSALLSISRPTGHLILKHYLLPVFILQMIPKSHKCGRVDHKKYSAQVEADLERVEYYKTKLGELIMIPNSISVRD